MINLVIYLFLYNFSPHYAQTTRGFKFQPKSYKYTHSTNIYNILHLSHYLNDHRKNNKFDYDYENWDDNDEETTIRQDTDTTITDKSKDTTVNVTTTTIILLNVTEASTASKTVKTSTQRTPSTDTTSPPVTKFTFPEETEKLLNIFVSTHYDTESSSPPSFHYVTYFPGVADDFFDHTVTRLTTTTNPFYEGIKEISKESGRFTASLIVLLKMLIQKNPKDITPLIATLNSRIQILNDEGKMLIFQGMAAEVFQAMLQMLASEPYDVMQDHFKYAEYALIYRHTELKRDVNGLLDIVETIYIETDIENIANDMRDIDRYPNGTKTGGEIIGAVIQDYFDTPFRRIHDTARAKLLEVELNDAIKRRLYPGEDIIYP